MASFRIYTLPAESELRIELDPITSLNSNVDPEVSRPSYASAVSISLLHGTGEIFGVELPPPSNPSHQTPGPPIPLPAADSVAVYTWYGCTLLIHPADAPPAQADIQQALQGAPQSPEEVPGVTLTYEATSSDPSSSTTSIPILNTHAQLESMRSTSNPPNVLIVGDRSSGRQTMWRTLGAYAAKVGRRTMMVNLDPAKTLAGVCPVGGGVGAGVGEWDGVGAGDLGGIGDKTSPIAFFYGAGEAGGENGNVEFYRMLVDRLGRAVCKRVKACEVQGSARSANEASSGSLILGCSGSTADVVEHHVRACRAFNVTVVIVVGHDRLYALLRKKLNDVKVIKIPKSGGAIEGEKRSMGRYFKDGVTRTYKLDELRILKMERVSVTNAMLPVGQAQVEACVFLKQVTDTVTPGTVLGVCHPGAVEAYDKGKSDLYATPVCGFVKVENVDADREEIVITMPIKGELPSKTMLMGEGITHVG